MRYKISINSKAKKILEKVPLQLAKNIRDRIRNLADNPRSGNVVKMKGFDTLYRLRVGDYRVIFEIHDDQVLILVINIGHRRDIYRR